MRPFRVSKLTLNLHNLFLDTLYVLDLLYKYISFQYNVKCFFLALYKYDSSLSLSLSLLYWLVRLSTLKNTGPNTPHILYFITVRVMYNVLYYNVCQSPVSIKHCINTHVIIIMHKRHRTSSTWLRCRYNLWIFNI